MNLYNKYRPKTLDEIVGNEQTVNYLQSMFKGKKIPQAFLLHGDTGCGKTTIVRIIADVLKCDPMNFREVDTATFRGIDTIREIRKQVKYKSAAKGTRVWLIDEVHKMTTDAQNAMLKLLEDPLKDIYFFLCTTDPHKLLPTVRGRCIELKMSVLNEGQIIELLKDISKKEDVSIGKKAMKQIALDSLGHPRNAIQIFEKVMHLPKDQMIVSISQAAQEQSESIALCRALISNAPWKKVSDILRNLKGQEPENVRRHVLAYAEAVLLKAANNKAAFIIEEFMEPLYNVGFPGLVLYSYSVTTQ